jgi:hypothetical protein
MSNMQPTWERLTAAARKANTPRATEPPHGFATRVISRWRAGAPESELDIWNYFARRTLVGAAVVMTSLLAIHYTMLLGDWETLSGASALFELMEIL